MDCLQSFTLKTVTDGENVISRSNLLHSDKQCRLKPDLDFSVLTPMCVEVGYRKEGSVFFNILYLLLQKNYYIVRLHFKEDVLKRPLSMMW